MTAYRTPLAESASPASVRLVTGEELRTAAPITLDDRLRQVPGFELFRRSSSLVANPTSQGVSLRGLGSTAASRTLVLSNEIPLNDAFGGWIYWDELPELSIGERDGGARRRQRPVRLERDRRRDRDAAGDGGAQPCGVGVERGIVSHLR